MQFFMQHSNWYSDDKIIDHIITSLNTGLFNCKIESPFQMPFSFYFIDISNALPPYLILPNVQLGTAPPCLLGPPSPFIRDS